MSESKLPSFPHLYGEANNVLTHWSTSEPREDSTPVFSLPGSGHVCSLATSNLLFLGIKPERWTGKVMAIVRSQFPHLGRCPLDSPEGQR